MLLLLLLLMLLLLPLTIFIIPFRFVVNRRRAGAKDVIVGFFHPYSNGGGGGERVLWQAIRQLHTLSGVRILIYTGDLANNETVTVDWPNRTGAPAPGGPLTGKAILQNAERRFNIEFQKGSIVEFIALKQRKWVEAAQFPRFTLIGQSLGSMWLAWEALQAAPPHIWLDTTGYAFSFPLAKFVFGCTTATYTHYPTISTDMLRVVFERRPTYNNASSVAGSTVKTWAKWFYYRLFALFYGLVGRCADLAMVNSTWTRDHIVHIWGIPSRTHIVYPPCDTTTLRTLKLEGREPLIISIGQFRPEKDHMLQISSFKLFISKFLEKNKGSKIVPRLVMIGGVRDDGDRERVRALREKVAQENLQEYVQFEIDAPFPKLQEYLGRALVGIHTMWNEHFGISVVEYMAAGAVTLAHNTAGPKRDIVVSYKGSPTGFLATTAEEYADALTQIFDKFKAGDQMTEMRQHARQHIEQFSDENFMHNFGALVTPLITATANKLKRS